MTSTTCLNLPTLGAHSSSSLLTIVFHFIWLFTIRCRNCACRHNHCHRHPTITLPISSDHELLKQHYGNAQGQDSLPLPAAKVEVDSSSTAPPYSPRKTSLH
ncbi:hypothetical protein VNO80_11201 [Phaseolus coccineus]|uniref:Uncharacterized protein n=1 Tax=Phaseolus coccineus TaxID=3886 RepID=A0AAN9NA30_PHACN